jgi:two-component system LytT family sensor kinase
MLKTEKRFHFWRVFWVVIAVYLFFLIVGLVFATMAPVTSSDKGFNWNQLLEWKHLLSQIAGMLFCVFFFYFTLNIYFRLFLEKKGAIQFLKVSVLGFFVFAAYQCFSVFVLSGKDEFKHMQGKEPAVGLLIFSLLLGSLFQIGLSVLIAYLSYLRDEKKQRKILEEQKMQLEVEKSQANFNFLKAQINPHFLHNTLNFLYAKSLPYSTELSEGILTLSDIMRYALSEGNARDGKAPLKDEIEHVRNVIKINQLRFSNNLNVQFQVEGVVNGAMIIPFVLITLVENAFKHGDLKSTQYPIEVKLSVRDGKLYFYCKNKKKNGPKELSTGIGLDNIKKRLDLAYGSNYALKVKDEADIYTTELTISKL